MNQPKKTFSYAAFFIICLLGLTASVAQTPPNKQSEPSFDIVLQTVTASNDAVGKSELPTSLAGIVKKLKTDFPFSAYRLTSTYMQRVNNRGNLESKSVSYASEEDKNYPVFSDWSLNGVEFLLDEKGQETIQVQRFRFGQRVPVFNPSSAVNYESVGLTTEFGLVKNTPTVIGSVTTSKPDELMFLILTVKSAEK